MKKVLVICISGLLLAGCASKGPDYKSTQTAPPLEVPPDLSGIAVDDSVSGALPGEDSATSYSGLQIRKDDPIVRLSKKMLPEFESLEVKRAGKQRWLVVKAEAEPLWLMMRTFILKLGLTIATENPETGIIETSWKKTKPLQEDTSKGKMARFWANLHSTGKADRFRFRLERGLQPGTMEVYISHRLFEEVALTDNNSDVMHTAWHPVAPDPVREIEMLRLLLVYLGNSKAGSKEMIEQAMSPAELASLDRNQKNKLELTLTDSRESAWRRLGLALDNIGFSVQDRDRLDSVYYVQHLGSLSDNKKRGFFSRMFGGDKEKAKEYYQVKLAEEAGQLKVEVRDKNGKLEKSRTGEQILTLLYEQLKY